MKFNSMLTNFVAKDLNAGKIPMLLGEPGIGKSSWTEALAASMQQNSIRPSTSIVRISPNRSFWKI